MKADNPIFHLSLTLNACLARVSLNGFQLAAVDARAPISVAPPINAFLVGKGNKLTVEAIPVITRSGMSSPLDIDINGAVAAFKAGDIVAPEGGGEVVLDINLKKALAGSVPSVPVRMSLEFDNDGPAFPGLFLESEVIEDPEPLIAYAMVLKGLFASQNMGGILEAFAPKLRDYGAGYYRTEASMNEEFAAFVQNSLFPGPMDLKFQKDEILPVSMCEGRIWELTRKPLRPLLSTMPDKDGGNFEIPVYVGLVDGGLRVVR